MKELSVMARKLRISALNSIFKAHSGHPGGVLSSIDLIYHLFSREMNYSVDDFGALERDRFILSKGHCAPALYAVAAEGAVTQVN